MIIADTGFWLALANRGDKHHEFAKKRLAELQESLIADFHRAKSLNVSL
jgi:predicted nucleic acid-binding protein